MATSIAIASNAGVLPASTWTQVGTVVPVGKNQVVSFSYNNPTSGTVSVHIGSIAPIAAPSLMNQSPLGTGGWVVRSPNTLVAGEAFWVNPSLSGGGARVDGFEETN
jgi:hypothetical protein